MIKIFYAFCLPLFLGLLSSCSASRAAAFQIEQVIEPQSEASDIHYYVVDFNKQELKLLWLNDKRKNYAALMKAKKALEENGETPLYLSNAGIYDKAVPLFKGGAPKGVYVENGKAYSKPDMITGPKGNFYWWSGVFTVTVDANGKSTASILHRKEWLQRYSFLKDKYFKLNDNAQVISAFQSGPVMMRAGKLTSAGTSKSDGYSRSVIAILKDGRAVIAHSQNPIAYADIAQKVIAKYDVTDMMFLDGTINDYWETGMQTPMRGYPSLGAMIAITEK